MFDGISSWTFLFLLLFTLCHPFLYSFTRVALTNPLLECYEALDDDGGGTVSGMKIFVVA